MSKYDTALRYLAANQHTWLITGVAGFIGSNLLETLLRTNQKVVGLDNFSTGYEHNLNQAIVDSGCDDAASRFTFIEGDVALLADCQKACSNVDFVLHQAALGSVPRSIKDPITTNRSNVDGFLNMLTAARDAQVRRFVYAASSSTYGDHPTLPKIEDKIGNPLSPYAVTKLVNELYASVFAKTYGFKSIGLRYFNIFGKRQDPQGAYAAVIPKWVSSILKKEEVFINGDGETSRDFCFVENAIQMNLLAALETNDDAADQIYNVALNDRTSLNQLHDMIQRELMKIDPSLEKVEPTYRDFRAGDVRHSQADITKAREMLGYEPTHRIRAGLASAMQWYASNIK